MSITLWLGVDGNTVWWLVLVWNVIVRLLKWGRRMDWQARLWEGLSNEQRIRKIQRLPEQRGVKRRRPLFQNPMSFRENGRVCGRRSTWWTHFVLPAQEKHFCSWRSKGCTLLLWLAWTRPLGGVDAVVLPKVTSCTVTSLWLAFQTESSRYMWG